MQQDENSDSFPPVAAANRVKVVLGINDLGGDMLRLTFLLCTSLFLVMLLGGRDFGQLRPGLALAEVDAVQTNVTAKAPAVETVVLEVAAAVVPEPTAIPAVAPVVAAAEAPAAVPAPILPEEVLAAVAAPPVTIEPENTVFTLSNYADPAPEGAAPAAEKSAEGEVWYVAGNSLNVRAGPSTNDEVVGKLSRGEATLVVSREGEDWARIRIEGDGIEGYVAMRFLTPDVPLVN